MKVFFDTIKNYQKLILQIALGLLFIFLGIYFIKHEKAELFQVKTILLQVKPWILLWGIMLVFLFVTIQGLMYKYSFKAVQKDISLKTGIILYLKRNFISIFIPAGLLTNMFFFNKEINQKHGIEKKFTMYASTLFSISSIASSILIAVPAVVLLIIKGDLRGNMLIGVFTALVLLSILVYFVVSIKQRGFVFHILEKKAPSIAAVLNDLQEYSIDQIQLINVIALSSVIEIIGVVHLYIAMIALNIPPSFIVAIIGYALVLIILLSSPFLKGIGAVELSLTYALTLFGYSAVAALSVAFLFRFFEFWSILILGLFALIIKKDSLLLRLAPALLLFFLGLVNILSSITPAIPERLDILLKIIPSNAIEISTWLVLFAGAFMLVVAIYLIKGLKNAWLIAVVLTSFTLVAHLLKGIDWEEAIIAGITLFSLIYTRKHYIIRHDLTFAKQRWFTAIVAFITVIIFGTIGFYFLDAKHFNANFSLWESLEETITAFFLFKTDIIPITSFAKIFLIGLHLMGVLTISFWAYLFLRPFIIKNIPAIDEDRILANLLVKTYGKGCLDYFKTYYDKSYWFNDDKTGFVSYKIAGNYAVVLENPIVMEGESLEKIISDFDRFCNIKGLRTAYYRIPASTIDIYIKLGKKILPIGTEAVANLENFKLQGTEKKPIRNAVNKLTKSNFLFKVYEPPQIDGFLQQLKAVSNEWLLDLDREEMVFSQGLFMESELKDQTILTIESEEKKIYGFINLIPNYVEGEANFDLIRKTVDAPNGTMDFLFVKMFEHLKLKGYTNCNLGMVPLSGNEEPKNLQERAMKTAYEKIKRFSHYKSLYNFKEKFDPVWMKSYMVYDSDLDLINLASLLNKVMKP